MDPRTLARLRTTGIAATFAKRRALRHLDDLGIPVVDRDDIADAVSWAKEHPLAPQLIYDAGVLDRSLELVQALERALEKRPVVVVIATALDQGLREIGWTRSVYRVGFVRADNLVSDLEAALDDLLAAEPELPPDLMPLVKRISQDDDDDDGTNPRFDVAALVADLGAQTAWAGAVVERVSRGVALRAAVADGLECAVTIAWLDEDGERFDLRFTAPLPFARSRFTSTAERGLLGAFTGAKPAQVIDGDEAGLAEVQALATHFSDPRARSDELGIHEQKLTWHVARLEHAHVVTVTAWVLELWASLVRRRQGY